jgi:hypothetical protein
LKKRSKKLLPVVCVALGAVVAVYAGLLVRSRWQADEYLDFALLREGGAGFMLDRLLHWGPRPWSELLLWAYGTAVNHVRRPLAGSAEAVLWAGWLLLTVGPAWRGQAGEARLRRVALGLGLAAVFLLGSGVAEVFYWPAGSVAYLPTLAAAAALLWCLADGIEGRRIPACAALVLAAGSSEVGVFLTLAFAACAVVRAGRRGIGHLWWIAPGVLLAGCLVVLLLRGRVGTIEIASTGPYVHHAGASLLAACRMFTMEMLGLGDASPGGPGLAKGLGVKALVFLAAWLMWPATRRAAAGNLLPALAAALILAAFATVATALYQFGLLCCERHETMRACFVLLAAATAGVWCAQRLPPRDLGALAPLPMLIAVGALFAVRAPALVEAYRLIPAAETARAQTWRSGQQAGTGSMTMVLMPGGRLIPTGDAETPGSYVLDANTTWYVRGVLQYFGKTRLEVR